jgi:REP-associated tyrosine transposase
VFDAPVLAWLQSHAAQRFRVTGCELRACEGESDRLYLLVEHPPKYPVSMLVNACKGTSSPGSRKRRPDIAARYRDGVLGSPRYCAASAGGAPLKADKRYFEQQRESQPV